MKKLSRTVFSILIFSPIFFACKTTEIIVEPEEIISEPIFTPPPPPETLTLLFAGDIMAHKPNYSIKDFDKIWEDVKDIPQSADFAFANIEAPVCDKLDWSTYPAFNMHKEYVDAAINAGFNVFSTANNHTNDKFMEGINGTKDFVSKTESKFSDSDRKIYFSGLKENDDFSYRIIQKGNWKILFVAITQLLNRPDCSSYINFVPSKQNEKHKFIEWCKNLKEQNPCDMFILSLHTNEDEYIRAVSKTQENWYNQLLDAGVDIIWANHAHIIKKQMVIKTGEQKRRPTKLVMCANGNTISAQRTSPNFNLNFTERDDTGDGLFYKVTLMKPSPDSKPHIQSTERIFITTYINTAGEFVLKKLDNKFIEYLEENRPKWVEYIKARKKVCEDISELRE